MNIRFFTILFCACTLTACTQEETLTTTDDDALSAVIPTAGLVDAISVDTRALSGPVTSFPTNTDEVFAVTAYKSASAPDATSGFDFGSGVYFENLAVNSGNSGIFSLASPQYYPIDREGLYFYAYGPVATAATTAGADGYAAGNGTTHPTVTWTIDGSQDIMYANVTTGIRKKSTEGEVQEQPDFTFAHLLKRIRFKLIKGPGFGDKLNATSISLTRCRTQATLDLISGELTFAGEETSLSLTGTFPINPETSANELSSNLLCQSGETLYLSVDVDNGQTYEKVIDLNDAENSDEQITPGGAGVNYLVTLTFLGTAVLPQVTIAEAWEYGGEASQTIQ
ncbi:MAG: fimbrillin family protein [Bacteroides sp.]|nr:fimbrillin family protein [Bacteroides sp.]